MPLVRSFEPIVGLNPRVLILGSMPGVVSLEAVEYYAHPRNLFWLIIAELFGIDANSDYKSRIDQITKKPVILWDTLRSCHRQGSLDSSILKQQLEVNDIVGLLERHQSLRAIAFNGAASEKYFNQLVKSQLNPEHEVALLKMPSTSPANAGMSYAQKLQAWKRIQDYI